MEQKHGRLPLRVVHRAKNLKAAVYGHYISTDRSWCIRAELTSGFGGFRRYAVNALI
jgi:hypothetical protein